MIKPAPNYILLKVDEEKEETTESGIILPEAKTDVHQHGVVISGGEYEAGTTVIFKRWAGEKITWEDKDYEIVHVKDVIAADTTTG